MVHERIVHRIQKFYPQVKRIADAKESVAVTVGESDTKNGHVFAPNACATAKACVRELGVDGALVYRSTAFLIKGTTALRYIVPISLKSEIVSYDRHRSFRPGAYSLYAPPPAQRMGAERPHNGSTPGKAGNHPRVVHRHRIQGVRTI